MIILKCINKLIDSCNFFVCPLCHEKATPDGFCEACMADISRLVMSHNVCPLCATLSIDGEVCGRCQKNPPYIDRLWVSYYYEEPIKTLLHHWKFRGQVDLSHCLQHLLLMRTPSFLLENNFDAVIAMPMSSKRLLEHGFHHTLELTYPVVKQQQINLFNVSHITREHRIAQSQLKRKERLSNLKNCFTVHTEVEGKNFLLMDDVVTTGASFNELAKTLKKQGASKIYAWALAGQNRQFKH